MKPTHIEHIGIAVKNLDEAIPFYEKVLGLECYALEEVKDQNKWRGITFQDIPSALAERLNLSGKDGVMISEVEEDSPCDDAGLRKGDVITSVNKIPIKNSSQFLEAVRKVKGDCLLRTNRGYIVVKKE